MFLPIILLLYSLDISVDLFKLMMFLSLFFHSLYPFDISMDMFSFYNICSNALFWDVCNVTPKVDKRIIETFTIVINILLYLEIPRVDSGDTSKGLIVGNNDTVIKLMLRINVRFVINTNKYHIY